MALRVAFLSVDAVGRKDPKRLLMRDQMAKTSASQIDDPFAVDG